MSYKIRRVDYFYFTVKDQPGEAYNMLNTLADLGISLLAFTAVPTGPNSTQITVFPEDSFKLTSEMKKAGLQMFGPNPAFLVQGDDELGALAGVHMKLYRASVNIYASSGVTDGKGSYGYVIYVRPEKYEQAAKTLGI